MNIHILKINNKKEIEISKNLYKEENYTDKENYFKASSLVKYFNAIDKEHIYISTYNLQEEILLIRNKLQKDFNEIKQPILLKNLLHKKSPYINIGKETEKLMKIKKNINEYNLNFKKLDLSENFIVFKTNRFNKKIEKSKIINKVQKNIFVDKTKKENKKTRNITVYDLTSLESKFKYIYNTPDREEDYYIEREIKFEEIIKAKLEEKKEKEGLNKDKSINLEDIKLLFLKHIIKELNNKNNLKFNTKKESWNEELFYMSTKFSIFDTNKLSIKEQERLIKIIFPSIYVKNKNFINKDRLKEKPNNMIIKKYKINLFLSIIKNSKQLIEFLDNDFFEILETALQKHKIRISQTKQLSENIEEIKKISIN